MHSFEHPNLYAISTIGGRHLFMLAIVASPLRAAQKVHCSPFKTGLIAALKSLASEWLLFIAADKKQLGCRACPANLCRSSYAKA